MRFLVALRHAGYARHLRPTLQGLCERGHEVVVLVGIRSAENKREASPLRSMTTELDELAADIDGLTLRPGVEPRGSRQRDLGGQLRGWLDYLRFLEPEFEEATKLRERALSQLPAPLREPTEAAATSPEFRAALVAMIRAVEGSLPAPEAVQRAIADEQPDAVVVSPLIERRSPQANYLRAAAALGIPSALCVASWDNLTTSTLIHGDPDLVTVWNEAQRQEATDLHGIPADRVAVTGAPHYDAWFELEPGSSGEDFRERVGLPAGRPFLLYLCSSGFIAPEEAAWICEWLEIVRGSGVPELADVPVLVRPHPQSPLIDDSAAARELQRTPGVAIHPDEGAITVRGGELQDYYDSIHHSAAVVGVNTSAMIESAIAGRGVHVLLTERYRDSQADMPHFAHLMDAGGGLVEATKKKRKHANALARAIRGEDRQQVESRNRSFLEAFIRPHGLDQPATPLLLDELERLAESPPAKSGTTDPTETLRASSEMLEQVFRIRTREPADESV